MKLDRRTEGEGILRNAETNLRESLLEILPIVAKTGQQLFMNSRFNPHSLPTHNLSKQAEALLETSLACVEMREALRLPVAGTVGNLYLVACEESASSNEHRREPRKLAAAILELLNHDA